MIMDSTLFSLRVGEIVDSSSDRCVVQCYELYGSPPLGTIVRIGLDLNEQIYAVVSAVSTGALDPGRPIVARGQDANTEEEIYRDNPQLSRLLATKFDTVIVGHVESGNIRHYLPPVPPKIHAFVFTCEPESIFAFTQSMAFLDNLLAATSTLPSGIADETVAGCLRIASICSDQPRNFLVDAGKVLALSLSNDASRLSVILRRLST